MKIYFGASFTLDRSLLPIYQRIVRELKDLGHRVVSEHVVDPNTKLGDGLSAKELFARESYLIDEADAMVADVTSPSWGTAFLIEHALDAGKPVLALYYKEAEMPLPMMIEGHPELYVSHYTKGNIKSVLKKHLRHFEEMKRRKGKLIVIDGTDGSGKGTQTKLLLDYLKKNKIKSKYIDFPRYYTSFHGKMVGRFLAGELGALDQVNPYLASLIYALDRLTARDELVDWLEDGNVVVANRYTTSSFAFQTVRVEKKKRKEFIKWLYQMEYKEHQLPKEDVVLFLYVPVEVSQELLEKKVKGRRYLKKGGKDINEANVAYQKEVLEMYLSLAKKYKHWEVIKCVDSKGKILPVDKIHKKILRVLRKRKIVK